MTCAPSGSSRRIRRIIRSRRIKKSRRRKRRRKNVLESRINVYRPNKYI
jgi:hypothetical protein